MFSKRIFFSGRAFFELDFFLWQAWQKQAENNPKQASKRELLLSLKLVRAIRLYSISQEEKKRHY